MNRKLAGQRCAYFCALGAVLATALAACKHPETKPQIPAAAASTIQIENQTDGIHISTPQAEFVLTANGSLVARRKDGNRITTIDELRSEPGIVIENGKQRVSDF